MTDTELDPKIEWLLVPEDHTEQSFLCHGFDPDGGMGLKSRGGLVMSETLSRDDLPDWVRDRLDVLGVIDMDVDVPGVGRRGSFSYWIWGDEDE